MKSRSKLVNEIIELLNNNLSEWIELHDFITKNCSSGISHIDDNKRLEIFRIFKEMKENGNIEFDEKTASNVFCIKIHGKYQSDFFKIRTTLKYDESRRNLYVMGLREIAILNEESKHKLRINRLLDDNLKNIPAENSEIKTLKLNKSPVKKFLISLLYFISNNQLISTILGGLILIYITSILKKLFDF